MTARTSKTSAAPAATTPSSSSASSIRCPPKSIHLGHLLNRLEPKNRRIAEIKNEPNFPQAINPAKYIIQISLAVYPATPANWVRLGSFQPEIGFPQHNTQNESAPRTRPAFAKRTRQRAKSPRPLASTPQPSPTPRRYTAISCSEFDLRPPRRAIYTSVVRALSSSTGSTPDTTAALWFSV